MFKNNIKKLLQNHFDFLLFPGLLELPSYVNYIVMDKYMLYSFVVETFDQSKNGNDLYLNRSIWIIIIFKTMSCILIFVRDKDHS